MRGPVQPGFTPRGEKRARHSDAPIPLAETVSEDEILSLVAKREQARQNRNYAESDQLRDALRNLGIEVYDKEKVWKSHDGRQGVLFTAGPEESSLSTAEIQETIVQREAARSTKDWGQADRLRENLRNLGVELDDKSSTWKTSTGRAGTYAGKLLDEAHQGAGYLTPGDSVEAKVAERERLRAAGDYEAADNMRRELSSQGVEVYDADRMWRAADGRSGVIVTGGHQGKCRMKDKDIQRKVSQREEARRDKDWKKGDKIRDELRLQGVELVDKQKTWSTSDGRHGNFDGSKSDYNGGNGGGCGGSWGGDNWSGGCGGGCGMLDGMGDSWDAGNAMAASTAMASMAAMMGGMGAAPMAAGFPSLSDASITALIHGRERARERRDWKASDAIRDDLKCLGVEVWDKDKVWRSSDGRNGTITKP